MTAISLTEIHQRLVTEFPGRYVRFEMSVSNGQDKPISIQLFDNGIGAIFRCSNLDDGINQLKLKLGLVQPEMEITI